MATTPAVDPELIHDAEQMKLLLQHPAWGVLRRRIEDAQGYALRRVMTPADDDKSVHHYRGCWTAFKDVLDLPEGIIAAERAARATR